MDSEQDAPGSWQALMVAFEKKHKYTKYTTSSQKTSGMAPVVKDHTVLPANHTIYPRTEWTVPASASPAAAGPHLQTRKGRKAKF